MNVTDQMQQELQGLKERSNLRTLPALIPVSYTHLTLPTNSRV